MKLGVEAGDGFIGLGWGRGLDLLGLDVQM